MSILEKAIEIAVEYHAGQTDKCGEPYVLHPLRVMLSLDGDTDAMIVGVLHDVVEDTEMTLFELGKYGFSDRIVEAVSLLSHIKNQQGKPTYKEYIRELKHDELARKVKMMDLMDNLSPVRMARLDEDTRKGLSKRYHWSMEELMSAECAASLPNDTVDIRKLLRLVEDDD